MPDAPPSLTVPLLVIEPQNTEPQVSALVPLEMAPVEVKPLLVIEPLDSVPLLVIAPQDTVPQVSALVPQEMAPVEIMPLLVIVPIDSVPLLLIAPQDTVPQVSALVPLLMAPVEVMPALDSVPLLTTLLQVSAPHATGCVPVVPTVSPLLVVKLVEVMVTALLTPDSIQVAALVDPLPLLMNCILVLLLVPVPMPTDTDTRPPVLGRFGAYMVSPPLPAVVVVEMASGVEVDELMVVSDALSVPLLVTELALSAPTDTDCPVAVIAPVEVSPAVDIVPLLATEVELSAPHVTELAPAAMAPVVTVPCSDEVPVTVSAVNDGVALGSWLVSASVPELAGPVNASPGPPDVTVVPPTPPMVRVPTVAAPLWKVPVHSTPAVFSCSDPVAPGSDQVAVLVAEDDPPMLLNCSCVLLYPPVPVPM